MENIVYLHLLRLGYEVKIGQLRADDYPKYVISASPLLKRGDDEGVTHIHIREFLKHGL